MRRRNAWDSNPGPQKSRRRRIHGARYMRSQRPAISFLPSYNFSSESTQLSGPEHVSAHRNFPSQDFSSNLSPPPSLITSSKAFAFKFYRVVLIQGSSDIFTDMQCYQIGRFIRLRATFQSLWQQLISPNLLHSLKIFVNVSKSLNFSSEIILANFYRHLESFYWSHC